METSHARAPISTDAALCESSQPDADGVQIDTYKPLDCVQVHTRNSVYELVVISGRDGEVLVRGGRLFPEFQPARLIGATDGGHTVKLLGVHLGLCMELFAGDRSVVTSPVLSVTHVPAPRAANEPHH
jgi:hypothetical protein